MYKRKTRDVYAIEGNYGCGWEELCEEETRKEAREQLKCYNENEPQYEHRIRKHREKIEEATA
jgi:hypothetical protein